MILVHSVAKIASITIVITSMVEAQGHPGLVGKAQERRPVGQRPWCSKCWRFSHDVQF
jgi:hypothetical protein